MIDRMTDTYRGELEQDAQCCQGKKTMRTTEDTLHSLNILHKQFLAKQYPTHCLWDF